MVVASGSGLQSEATPAPSARFPARAVPELFHLRPVLSAALRKEKHMNSIIYLVGLVVVVIAVLSLLGLS